MRPAAGPNEGNVSGGRLGKHAQAAVAARHVISELILLPPVLGQFDDLIKLFNLIGVLFNRNSYRSEFCHMYGRLTQNQVGKSNRADGGEGE